MISLTPHNSKKNELFRFIALRTPRLQKRINTRSELYIEFPETKINQKESLFLNYTNATKNFYGIEQFKKGKALLEKFKTTDTYYKTIDEIHSDFPQFLPFYDWLVSIKTDDKKYIEAQIQKTFGKSNPLEIAKNYKLISKVWDNYCAHVVEHSNPEIIQGLTNILRVINILNAMDSKKSVDFNSMEKALILLPSNLFPKPEPGTVTQQPSSDNPDENVDETPSQISDLKTIHSKIRKSFADVLQASAGTVYTSESVANYSISSLLSFNLNTVDSLDKKEKAVVNQLIEGSNNLPYTRVLEIIQDNIQQLYSTLKSKLNTSITVALIGNKAVELDQEEGIALKNLISWSSGCDGNSQNPFSVIYPCLFQKNPEVQLNFSIGEFKRVESEISCYSGGEIAHIENVLRGEEKIRETRRLDRVEEKYTYETESSQEEERDVQTTDRYEMERETQNTIDTDTSITTGVNVSANYGGIVQVDANLGFSTNISTHDSTRNAVEYAKSITDRARKKIFNRTLESRTTTHIREFEEKNSHKLTGPTNEHTVGIYRWVNKTYDTRLMNYGKRLMLQVNIPEPAAYHKFNMIKMAARNSELLLEKPINPASQEAVALANGSQNIVINPLRSFKDINEFNYHIWAAAYGAEITIPPVYQQTIGKSYNRTPGTDSHDLPIVFDSYSGSGQDIKIPEGYRANHVYFVGTGSWIRPDNGFYEVRVNVGGEYLKTGSNGTISHRILWDNVDTLPVSWEAHGLALVDFNLEVVCIRSYELMDEWQKKMYGAIMNAYNNQLDKYNQMLQESQIQTSIEIEGQNPAYNKETIVRELKRNAIEFIRFYNHPWMQHYLMNIHSSTPAMGTNSLYDNMPIVQNQVEAMINGKYADFMENCFEWTQMTYDLYPYYWGHPTRWTELYKIDDPDPLFRNFLQAGSTSVLIPVKPGFEKHLMYYIHTGKLWMGGDTPLIDTNLNHYIDTELSDYDPTLYPFEEDNWKETVPTSLVVLQEDANGIDDDIFCS